MQTTRYIWVGVGVIAIYYAVVVLNSLNIPFADDLSVLASQYDIHTATRFQDVVATLLSFHNEHRLLVPRLITIGLAKLHGNVIDFRWWIWAGNAWLLLILYVFYRVFVRYQKPMVFFLPVVLLLFQPLHTELVYWGMASLQNIGVLAVAALALYLVTVGERPLIHTGAVALLTVMAMLTGANGMLLILSVAFVWLVKRRYALAVGWLVVGGIAAVLYWRGFVPDPHTAGSVKTSPTLFDSGLTFLGLMGAFIESQRFGFLSVLAGLIFVSAFVEIVLRKLPKLLGGRGPNADSKTLFLLAYSSFLLLTISAIAISRYLDAALHVSRYKLYPVLLIICFYLLWLDRLSRPKWPIMAIVTICLLFNAMAYVRAWPVLLVHRTYLVGQLDNWQRYRRVDAPTRHQQQYYEQRWTNTYREGMYRPPVIDPNNSFFSTSP